jgi:hypothetical protein
MDARSPRPHRQRAPRSCYGLSVGTLGAATSILIHALLFAPLMFGTEAHRIQLPNSEGASASQNPSDSEQSMTVVFINNPQSIRSETEGQAVPVTTPELSLRQIRVEDHSRFIKFETREDLKSESEADGDQTGHAMLFGRYLGQISARIQRAWLRPRTPVENGSFSCRVQISQDRSGVVQEVALQKCNSDLHWQASLIQAIQSASPLPAPPDANVFSNLLTLELSSQAYVAGLEEDGYEAVPTARTAQIEPSRTRLQLGVDEKSAIRPPSVVR